MKQFVVFLLFSSIILTCQSPLSQEKIIGVKIYNHESDFDALIQEWKSIGINTAFVSKELLANNDFRKQTCERQISTFVILPTFFDEQLDDHPEFYAIKSDGEKAIAEWVKFACPSNQEYRKMKVDVATKLVKDHDPDGISIDFIRHFVYWEKVYPDTPASNLPNTCFCDRCVGQFCVEYKIDVPDSLTEILTRASWILDSFSAQWTSWKCNLITTMIDEIVTEAKKVKPDVLVNLHIVPWKNDSYEEGIKRIAGQDLKAIAPMSNYLSPMTYSYMTKQNASWVHEVVVNIITETGAQVLPSIQVKEAYLSDTLSSAEFKENLKSALLPPSSGVVFWSWEHLEQDPWKKEIIRSVVN